MWRRSFWLLFLPGAVAAQEPRDPYAGEAVLALAVDPAEHRGEDYVYLLQDGHLSVEANGHTSYTYRQVVQILTDEGASQFGQFSLPYDPVQQDMSIDWMRVYRDGRLVSEGAEHQQEAAPSVDQNAPIYSDVRMVQGSIAGVRPGAILDMSTTTVTSRPRVPGDYWFVWNLNGLDRIVRSRFVVDRPESVSVRIREHGEGVASATTTEDGRRVTTWTTEDADPIEVELFAGFPNDVVQYVSVSGATSWEEIGTWYEPFMDEEPVLGDDLIAAHDAELAGAKTLRDSLEATYRWVAQDFRYVSLSLGDGGYRPRQPRQVFETGFGDCKDKTTLFVALARRLGVVAYPVLVAIDGGVDPDVPTLRQFDHMVAALELDGETLYFDLTSAVIPFGELPPVLDDEGGLIVPEPGRAEFVSLPATDPDDNELLVAVEGEITMAVGFEGSVTVTARGTEQYGLRQRFFDSDALDDRDRDEILRQMAQSVYETAVVDSSRIFNGRDLGAPARVTVWFRAPRVLGRAGDQYLLYMPLPSFVDANTLSEVQSDDERRFPIDIAQVNSPSVYRTSLELDLPEGWSATVPDDVVIKGEFGHYAGSYGQRGNHFEAFREMGGSRGLLPPEKADALVEWVEGVASDDADYILLDPDGGSLVVSGGGGALAEILLTEDDLGPGATMTADGRSGTVDSFELLHTDPLARHARDFNASQMVFQAGESPMAALAIAATEHRTHDEALKNQRMFDLIDLGALFGSSLEEIGGFEGTAGEARTLTVPALGDGFKGWVVPLRTPLATFDLFMGVLVRGRVSVSAFAVGAQGMRSEDIGSLFGVMDERVQAHAEYLSDLDPADPESDPEEPLDVADRADGYHLEAMLPGADDIPGSMLALEEFDVVDRVARLDRELEGQAFTFGLEGVDAIWTDLKVELFPSEAWALKAAMRLRDGDRRNIIDVGDMPAGLERVMFGEDSAFQALDAPDLGTLSFAGTAKLRALMNVDFGYAVFLTGRLLTTVQIMSPPEELDPAAPRRLAEAVYARIEIAAPDLTAASADDALVAEVERVIELEKRVNSLVDEDRYEEILELLEGRYPEGDELTFQPSLWNNICWYGALDGYAEQVMPACEAAMRPDARNLGRLDSRALAKALAGDVDGAIDDFQFIVDNVVEGEWKEQRAGWLRALQDGSNPFTEDVLADLR